MNEQHGRTTKWQCRGAACAGILAAICFLTLSPAIAQQPRSAPQAQPAPAQATSATITPAQAQKLFSLVDTLIKFDSEETGLPIRSQVKRQLISRDAVESFLKKQMDQDQAARRMERDEVVLKKFGLLDRDFDLKPFLLSLLREQVAAFYDSKTKTVYLLNWVPPDEQKMVLAHELTHALQDQHSNLQKWSAQTPQDVSLDAAGDTDHLAKDEMDLARQAVVEGQATVAMIDYELQPKGESLVNNPELIAPIQQMLAASSDSPILARAPLLLSQSLLFPYSDGLGFEQAVWMDQGRTAAFAGTLDHPPTSTWEILNPREYERRATPPIPLLPNIHPLLDQLYTPYEIGQMGPFDTQILAQVYGGEQAAHTLTPAWNGGLYWAGRKRGTAEANSGGKQQDATSSIALFYLSAWKNAASAADFAQVYVEELGRKYSGLKLISSNLSRAQSRASSGFTVFPPPDASSDASEDEPQAVPKPSAPTDPNGPPGEQVYATSEGPVVITQRGKLVFVSESFPLPLARKLAALILDAQSSGAMQTAGALRPAASKFKSDAVALEPLTGSLIRFFADCGVMKAALDAGVEAAGK